VTPSSARESLEWRRSIGLLRAVKHHREWRAPGFSISLAQASSAAVCLALSNTRPHSAVAHIVRPREKPVARAGVSKP